MKFINSMANISIKSAKLIPFGGIFSIIRQFGNHLLYEKQEINFDSESQSNEIKYVISLIYKYKKG